MPILPSKLTATVGSLQGLLNRMTKLLDDKVENYSLSLDRGGDSSQRHGCECNNARLQAGEVIRTIFSI